MNRKRVNIEFQKGEPSFLTKIKEAHGVTPVQLEDKFKHQTHQEEDFDVHNAQVINQETPSDTQINHNPNDSH